jgi:REase_DpnII-MboI
MWEKGVNSLSIASVLDGVVTLQKSHKKVEDGPLTEVVSVGSVLLALNSFTDIVRYLNTRRSTGAVLELSNEAAVQDALYLMLRPWILDLTPENPTSKVANRYSIKDFVSQTGKFVIEAKFVRNSDHGKSLAKEINDDIETYRYHPNCNDLIFFIYDPDGNIPDATALERHVRTNRTYDGKILRCHGIIKP